MNVNKDNLTHVPHEQLMPETNHYLKVPIATCPNDTSWLKKYHLGMLRVRITKNYTYSTP